MPDVEPILKVNCIICGEACDMECLSELFNVSEYRLTCTNEDCRNLFDLTVSIKAVGLRPKKGAKIE